MARLRHGFEVLREEADEHADQRVAESDHAPADLKAKASNPHRAARGQVRPGDKAALDEFARKHNLN